jgi:hypothetical protein
MALSLSSVLHYWTARNGVIPYVGGSPVHSRASIAKWVDQMAGVRDAPVNTPRFEWATISGENRPVMRLERSRNNVIHNSEQFSQWTTSNATVTTDDAFAPDGTATADKITPSSLGGYVRGNQITGNIIGTPVAVSVWMKSRSGTKNVVLGVLSQTDASVLADTKTLTEKWQRFTLLGTPSGTATTAYSMYLQSNADLSAFDVWGAQFEVDVLSATSYIKTTTAQATRSAENFHWTFIYPPQTKYFYLRFIERGHVLDTNGPYLVSIGNASLAAAYVVMYRSGAGNFYRIEHHNGTTSVGATLSATPNIGDLVELLGAIGQDGSVTIVQSINGAPVTSVSSGPNTLASNWSGRQLWLNGNSGVSTSIGHNDYAELKVVKAGDVVGGTSQAVMDELRAFELSGSLDII